MALADMMQCLIWLKLEFGWYERLTCVSFEAGQKRMMYPDPTDMRKSFYSLSGIVTNEMEHLPHWLKQKGILWILSKSSKNPPKFLNWLQESRWILLNFKNILTIRGLLMAYRKKTNIASPLGQRAWKVYGYPRLVCVDILRFQQLIKILYFTYFIHLFGLILWCSMLDVHIYQFLNM